MDRCFERCKGRFALLPGSQTIDNKSTWVLKCEAGNAGGCKGPDYNQLQEFSQMRGKEHGASPAQEPLVFSEFGRPIARTWRTPYTR